MMRLLGAAGFAGLLLLTTLAPQARATQPPAPTELEALDYTTELFPGVTYDPAVPTVADLIGFPVGERAASPEQIDECLQAWARTSPRTKLTEYARSFEGRPLYTMAITSPANLARLDEIRAGIAQLADPRGLSAESANELVDSLPAVAWLAYSIHGNESSGSDAALALLYHLAAAQDAEVEQLLEDLVVLVDPMMNPDGRARFLKTLAEHRGTSPNLDDQSLLHSGYWPWGRMNHYLFDLNRDWTLGINPESRGRIRAAGEWYPLLFVDAHEMGSQDTYLFSPARAPRSPHLPARREHWSEIFASDQAKAFDRLGWAYYTGEWNEGWYPGYSDVWGAFRGAVGILYEQASVDEDAMRHRDGSMTPYRESVHHHLVSSMANLRSLHANAHQLKNEFLEERRSAVAATGPYAGRTWAVLPTANRARLASFLDLMALQGFEVYSTDSELTGISGVDQLGRSFVGRTLPVGTILIPGRQPEAHLLAAMMEFDAVMPPEYFQREREELVRRGRSTIYDVTAWNTTMLHGLQALTLSSDLPAGAVRLESPQTAVSSGLVATDAAIGYVFDGADDNSVVVAARLMEQGIAVRIADKEFRFDDRDFSRGSVVVTKRDNRSHYGSLPQIVATMALDLGIEAIGFQHGLGEGELADIGGRHFRLLEPPSIAILARGGISPYDFGSIWFTLDQRFAIRHSHLNEEFLTNSDLRRYNVLVIPDRWFGEAPEGTVEAVKAWVKAGGTLIAIGDSAGALADEEVGISQVRKLPDVLEDLDDYELAITREWMVRSEDYPDRREVWSHSVPIDVPYPWQSGGERPSKEELERRDKWQQIFMPQGAILAGRVDSKSWLTFGAEEMIPVLAGDYPVLMATESVEAPVRFGMVTPSTSSDAAESAEGNGEARTGWATLPEGHELRLRMSGLLWPEAAQRLAHSAYLTREGLGNGQVILFAAPPTFRATTMGTMRLLTNAMIYGPGLGAMPAIKP